MAAARISSRTTARSRVRVAAARSRKARKSLSTSRRGRRGPPRRTSSRCSACMKVQKDAVVSLHVEVSDATGWRAQAQDFAYLHGHGNLFPKLEAALARLVPGGDAERGVHPRRGA